MRRTIVVALVALLCGFVPLRSGMTAHADTCSSPTTRWHGCYIGPLVWNGGTQDGHTWPTRNYYVYVPPTLQPAGQRALVVYLHGTTQTATQAALGARWNDLADQKGFVVLYPEEDTGGSSGIDNSGGNASRAWPWSRASFEGRDDGEFRAIADMTKKLMSDYAVDPGRVYMSGLSAGAIMATVMAATYPDLYAGEASWAGCAYLCSDASGDLAIMRMGALARNYPVIMFAGSTDYLVNVGLTGPEVSGAVGMNDLADDGQHNGSVTMTSGPETFGDPTEISPNTGPDDGSRGDLGTCLFATTNTHGNNPCPGGDLGWSSYPYTVTRFGNDAVPNMVESWYIHGISHNYSGGSTEGTFADPLGPDTTTAAWDFLEEHSQSVPAVSIGDASVVEGNTGETEATFPVSLAAPYWKPVEIDVATFDGTATAESGDYAATQQILTIPAGSTSDSFTVPIEGDGVVEPDETFGVALSTGATGTGTIVNDDVPPLTTIDAGPTQGSTVKTRRTTLSFSSEAPGAVFRCRYDTAAFATCASPYTAALKNGTHTFDVYAVDGAGNSGPVVSRSFTVKKRR